MCSHSLELRISAAYNSVGTICASKSLKNITGELQPILFSALKISIEPFFGSDYHVVHCCSEAMSSKKNKK